MANDVINLDATFVIQHFKIENNFSFHKIAVARKAFIF